MRRNGNGQFWVKQGNFCRHKRASDRHLVIVFGVGNDRRKGYLTSRARCRRYGDERQDLLFHCGLSLKILYPLSVVGNQNANGFGTVDNASPTDGNHRIGIKASYDLSTPFDVSVLRIWIYSVKNVIKQFLFLQDRSYFVQ